VLSRSERVISSVFGPPAMARPVRGGKKYVRSY
jgi:hypothetical protein